MHRTGFIRSWTFSNRLKLANFRNSLKFGSFLSINHENSVHTTASTSAPSGGGDAMIQSSRLYAFQRSQKISKAMQVYLEKSREKEIMLQQENAEFELGKRHLANMMGLNPDTMTQDDVDAAIRYLLPSGLFAPKARPMMKPPSEIFPPITPAEFSPDGRPFDDMFFTTQPRFYQHLYLIYEKVEQLDKLVRQQTSENKKNPDKDSEPPPLLVLTGTKWFDQENLTDLFMHKITEEDTSQFAAAMEYLASHPLAYMEKDFIMAHRQDIVAAAATIVERVTETKTDEHGRVYAEATARKKSADAYVKLYQNGTGKFSIDGGDMMNLDMMQSREQLLFPFIILDRNDEFDVEARTEGGGESGKVVAIRMAVCKALCAFVTEQEVEKMRLAGLLTRDVRRKERKKWERKGARERPVWKKR